MSAAIVNVRGLRKRYVLGLWAAAGLAVALRRFSWVPGTSRAG